MRTLIHERVEAARAGTNPAVVCRMPSGWLVLADRQPTPGHAILLPDPVVANLNALDDARRGRFLMDMARVGDALLAVTDAHLINYEILGNTTPALHGHIVPRYAWEPEAFRLGPVWFYGWDSAPELDIEKTAPLRASLRTALAGGS